MPGFSKRTRLYPKISQDVRRFTKGPKNSEDVSNNSESLNTTSSSVCLLEKSNISGKVSSLTRLLGLFFSHIAVNWVEFAYFWKVCQLKLSLKLTFFQPDVRNWSHRRELA